MDHKHEIDCQYEALKQLTHGDYSIIDIALHNAVFVAFRTVVNNSDDNLLVKDLISEASAIVGYDIRELF